MRVPLKRFYFSTLAEAYAFSEGVEYVNDSQLRIVYVKTRVGMADGQAKSAMVAIKTDCK